MIEVMASVEFTPEENEQYRRPVVRRKSDPMPHLLCSPCYEDVFWKSYASAELLAKMENAKYVLKRQSFARIMRSLSGKVSGFGRRVQS